MYAGFLFAFLWEKNNPWIFQPIGLKSIWLSIRFTICHSLFSTDSVFSSDTPHSLSPFSPSCIHSPIKWQEAVSSAQWSAVIHWPWTSTPLHGNQKGSQHFLHFSLKITLQWQMIKGLAVLHAGMLSFLISFSHLATQLLQFNWNKPGGTEDPGGRWWSSTYQESFSPD
jgi:hypothetical protein